MVTFAVIVAVHVLVLEVVMMLLGGDACFDGGGRDDDVVGW